MSSLGKQNPVADSVPAFPADSPSMNFWVIVYAIGAAQAALLALALWRQTANPQANRVLAAWLAIAGADLAIKSLYLAVPGPVQLAAFRFVALLPFLYGSLFYLYVRALTTGRGFAMRDTAHLAGYLLVLAMTLPLFIVGPERTTALFAGWSADGWPPRWFDPFLFSYSLSYVIAALVRVHRYRRRLRQQRSDADRLSLRWVETLALGQILIWCIAVAATTIRIPGVDYYLIYGAVAAWVCVVGWFSLGQPPVIENGQSGPDDAEQADARDDDQRFPAVEARLSQLMAHDALYREPALTIGQLARRSGYPEYLVSAVINQRLGGNFWEYINRHRVEAARTCLADPEDGRTILDIAYACGFTSKSTFNAAFKRQVGQTPSAYRRQPAETSEGGSS
jgi:AraC-like DNA-binding protein